MNQEVEKTIVNYLLDTVRKNNISQEELDQALEKVRKVYYTDGIIK